MRCQHEASVRAHSRRAFTGGSLSWALHRPPSLPQPPPSTVCCLPVRPPNAPSCLPPIPLPPPYIAGWRRERKRAGDPIPSSPLSLSLRRFSSRRTAIRDDDAGGDLADAGSGGASSARVTAAHRQNCRFDDDDSFVFLSFTFEMRPLGFGLIGYKSQHDVMGIELEFEIHAWWWVIAMWCDADPRNGLTWRASLGARKSPRTGIVVDCVTFFGRFDWQRTKSHERTMYSYLLQLLNRQRKKRENLGFIIN
jgi:hypothetical protein